MCLKRRREKTTSENLSLFSFYVPPSICVELGTKIQPNEVMCGLLTGGPDITLLLLEILGKS